MGESQSQAWGSELLSGSGVGRIVPGILGRKMGEAQYILIGQVAHGILPPIS